MATNLNISENQERVPLRVGGGGLLRTITPDNGSPYYVGARAYVTQTAGGAIVTVIDKDGTTTATILNGTNGTNGQDGNGIADISKTGSSANVDEYTITYTDGTTETFYVTNGIDGVDGTDGVDGYSPSATVSKVGTTATITITDKDGTTTAEIHDGGASAFVAEFNVTTYADVKDAYDNDAILICTVPDGDNTMVLQFVYFDDTYEAFFFAIPVSDGWYLTHLSNADGWGDGQFYFASTDVATQLADGLMSALDKQKLDGLSKRNIWYGTCSTSASSSPKSITTASGDFSLTAGNMLVVLFSHANSLSSASLQIDGGTAKAAYPMDGTSDISNRWGSNELVMFAYDGTKFIMLEQGKASTTAYGITKLNNTVTSTSTSEAATANAVKTAYDNGGVQSVNGNTGAVSLSIHNVPSGGSSGQVLSKASGTDYDLAWATPSSGSVTDVTVDGVSVVTGGVASVDLTGKQDELVSGVSIRTINGTSVLGSGDISVAAGGTPIPTADTVAEFDSSACMNSSDMSAQDISDFVDALDVGKDYAIINDSVPIGAIEAFAGSTAPYGWLICDGSAVSRTTYDKLFEAIGTTYGSGDGSTTFNIPDLRGRVAIGAGTGTATDATAHTLGSTGGAETHKLTVTEMPSHTHGHYYYGGSGASWGYNYSNGSSTKSAATEAASGIIPNGGGGAHNNLQPYTVANYIIKAFNKDLAQAEPSVINTMADFIVDEGTETTSGITWTYRKWNNGTAECWGIWEGNLTHYYTGNGLYGYSLSPCTFPTSLFTGVPTVNADGRIGNGFYVGTSIDASASSANIVAMGTASGTNACKFHISAKGVWK